MAEEKAKSEKIIEATEKELEELREYIEEFISFLPLSFCMVNSLDFILDVNQSFENLTGYEKLEVIGNDIEFLFRDKEVVEDFKEEVSSSEGAVDRRTFLSTKEGKEVPVEVSALARKDRHGSFSGYFLTITDITKTKEFEEELERKIKERTAELEKAKEKLERSEAVLEIKINARTRELKELNENLERKVEERTKELQERAKELEKSQTALLNILEENEESLRKVEREREKTLAVISNFADGLFLFNEKKELTLINPEAGKMFNVKAKDVRGKSIKELKSLPALESLIEVIGEKIEDLFRKEMQISDNFFLEITTIPIIYKGKNFGTLVNVHDITREKQMEQIKTEFVSVAAHQLRTPLSGVKWTLKTILEEMGKDAPEEHTELLEKAYDANNRMVSLINDLLNVTRIEEGRYIYKPEEVDLMEIISPIIEEYKSKIEEKKLKLQVEKPKEELPKVKIDKEKIEMVIQNFLDNAVNYTKEGGVVIVISKEEEEIKVSITDTGVGIPDEQKKRIFTKFFRAANVMRMETEGSGIGLFIAKNIIDAHGGKIGFTSKAEEGSTFYFTIPFVK